MTIENTSDDCADSPKLTRRRLLGSAAGMAAVAAASALMPPNVRRALAQSPPKEKSLGDIKHVVMLMQENRSFDHYFGTMAGVRGFDDPNALKLPNGRSVFYQPDPENPTATCCRSTWTPARPARRKSLRPATPGRCSTSRWNGGKMDNWLPAHRKADGGKSALRHGLSHAGRHPVSIRAGRGVHDLRRLPLLRDGPDLAEPHVLDDRHDRSRRRSTAAR